MALSVDLKGYFMYYCLVRQREISRRLACTSQRHTAIPLFTLRIMRISLLSLLIAIASPVLLRGQSPGYDYWGAFPYLGDEKGTYYITISGDTASVVTITTVNGTQSYSVSAGSPVSISFTPFPTADEQIGTGSILIHSGHHIIADLFYYEPTQCEATLLREAATLGNQYSVLTEPSMPEFLIVAPSNNTQITIIPTSQTLNGSPKGTPINVTLQSGDVYEVQGIASPQSDFSGTTIESNNPVAVFTGNSDNYIPSNVCCANPLYEELPPTGTWCTTYYTVPFAVRKNGDAFRILAATNGTNVSINNGPPVVLNQSQPYDIVLTQASLIQASSPVLVAQCSHSGYYDDIVLSGTDIALGDPSLLFVPPSSQTTSNTVFTVPNTNNQFTVNYLNVVW